MPTRHFVVLLCFGVCVGWGLLKWDDYYLTKHVRMLRSENPQQREAIDKLFLRRQQALPWLMKGLAGSSIERRRATIRILSFGDVSYLPSLEQMYERHKDWRVRDVIVQAIGRMRPRHPKLFSFLRRAMKSPEPEIKDRAIHGMAGYGEKLPMMLSAFETLLRKGTKPAKPLPLHDTHEHHHHHHHEDGKQLSKEGRKIPLCLSDTDLYWSSRLAVLRSLAQAPSIAKQALPLWLLALRDKRVDVQRLAEEQIVRVGEQAIPGLVSLILQNPHTLRERGTILLSRMKSQGQPPLWSLYQHSDPAIWFAALRGLGRLKSKDKEWIHAFCLKFPHFSEDKKRHSSQLLASFGVAGFECLAKLAKSRVPVERYVVSRALGRIKPAVWRKHPAWSRHFTGILLRSLSSKVSVLVKESLFSLGIVSRGEDVARALLRWWDASEKDGLSHVFWPTLSQVAPASSIVRARFIQALAKQKAPSYQMVKAFGSLPFRPDDGHLWLSLLSSNDISTREYVAGFLAKQPRWLARVQHVLARRFRDATPSALRGFLALISKAGDRVPALVPGLVRLCLGRNDEITEFSLLAFAAAKRSLRAHIDSILPGLETRAWTVKRAALTMILRSGVRTKRVFAWVVKRMLESKWQGRVEAVRVLGHRAFLGKEAISVLQQTRKDPSFAVKSAAYDILRPLGKWAK